MSAFEKIMNTEETSKYKSRGKSKRSTTPPRNKNRNKLNNHFLKFKDRLGKILFNTITMIIAFVIIGYIGTIIGTISNSLLISFYQHYVLFLGLVFFISFKIS
jgi:hypothetical protein